jgi:hypothetical protein
MNPAFHGLAYGLRVVSDACIPGLIHLPPDSEVDLEIRLGLAPHEVRDALRSLPQPCYVSFYQDERGDPVCRHWELDDGAFFLVRYSDGTEFVIDGSGSRVWATWPDELNLEEIAACFLGPVFGFILGLRGTHCLHASVVSVEGNAVAFLGPAGSGKSTTAAAFARRGFPVITEDVAAVTEQDGRYFISPAYPRIRLWPSSVEALYGSSEALPRITPTWDKRHLDLTEQGYHFQTSPRPLAAIYTLAPRRSDSVAPCIEPVSGQEALMSLISNTYAAHTLDQAFRTREFCLFHRLLRRVVLRRVVPHQDLNQISRLCDAILNDLDGLSDLS